MLSCIGVFITPWTVTHEDAFSMEFSRQEYWNLLPFPTQGDLPDPGIKPRYLSRILTVETFGKPQNTYINISLINVGFIAKMF